MRQDFRFFFVERLTLVFLISHVVSRLLRGGHSQGRHIFYIDISLPAAFFLKIFSPFMPGTIEQFEDGLEAFMGSAQEIFAEWYGRDDLIRQEGGRFERSNDGTWTLVGSGGQVRTWDCLKASDELRIILQPYLTAYGVTPRLLVGPTNNGLFTRDVILAFTLNGSDYRLSLVPTSNPLFADVTAEHVVQPDMAAQILTQRIAFQRFSMTHMRPISVERMDTEGQLTQMLFAGLKDAGNGEVAVNTMAQYIDKAGNVVGGESMEVVLPIAAMGSVDDELARALAGGNLETRAFDRLEQRSKVTRVVRSGVVDQNQLELMARLLGTRAVQQAAETRLASDTEFNYASPSIAIEAARAALNETGLVVVPDAVLAGLEAAELKLFGRFMDDVLNTNAMGGRVVLFGPRWSALNLKNSSVVIVSSNDRTELGRALQGAIPAGADRASVQILSDDKRLRRFLQRHFGGLTVELVQTGTDLLEILKGMTRALMPKKMSADELSRLVDRWFRSIQA